MSKGCSRLLALCFAVLFVIAGAAAIFFYHLEFTLLQPDAYIDALQSENLQDRLTAILADELAERFALDPCVVTPELCNRVGGPPVFLVQLSEDHWREVIELLVTPGWVVDQAEMLLRGTFNLLSTEDGSAVVSIDVLPVKDRLRGEPGLQAVQLIISSLPACTPDQVAQLAQLIVAGGSIDQLLVCSPPPEILSLVEPIMENQLGVMAAELPDSIAFDLANSGLSSAAGDNIGLDQVSVLLQQGLYLSAAIAGVSLVITLLLAVRSLRGLFFWIGWPSFALGLIVLLGTLVLRGSSDLIVGLLVSPGRVPMLQPETVNFIIDLGDAVIRSLLRGILFLSVGITILGFFLTVISRLFPGETQSSPVRKRPENLY